MPPIDSPNVNVIALASDDDLWVVETDLAGLTNVLKNPAQFVATYVNINGKPGVLVQPFVIVFQENFPTESGPEVLVQGINETSLLTVKYVAGLKPEPSSETSFAPDEVNAILLVDKSAYSHLQFTDRTPEQVGDSIIRTITTPEIHFAELNALPQTVNGKDMPDNQKLIFEPTSDRVLQVVYQGTVPYALSGPEKLEDGPPNMACEVTMGDSNPAGQVIVNNIIVKTYPPVN